MERARAIKKQTDRDEREKREMDRISTRKKEKRTERRDRAPTTGVAKGGLQDKTLEVSRQSEPAAFLCAS